MLPCGAQILAAPGARIIDEDAGTRRSGDAQVDLPEGRHPFVLELFKNREGRPASFTLFAEGPGVERQPLHAATVMRPGTPTGPIQMTVANEPTLLRGFVQHGETKRTHAISVGDPSGIHYV